jgi:radical SAM superfamily enzyme YgiQ (UPF0313 family)
VLIKGPGDTGNKSATMTEQRKKIVLVRPPFLGEHTRLMGPGLVYPIFNKPPMNLLYLATPIHQEGRHSIEVVDAAVMHFSVEQTAQVVMSKNPDIVGIMAYLPMLPEAKLLASALRSMRSDAVIIIGGPIVEFYPQEILSWDEVDLITIKEAEPIFRDLVEAIGDPEKLKDIPGIAYKLSGQTIFTSPGSFCTDLDAIPFPDRTLVPYKKYSTFMCEAPYSTVLLTSRGCSFKCRFCHNANRRRRMIYYRSVKNIVGEIEQILDLGIRKIFIYDDSFCSSRSRVLEFCDEVLARGLPKFSYSIKARVKQLDEEILRRLKETGCTTLGFGLESGVNRVLELMDKQITTQDSARALRLARQHGFITMGYFVLGFPGETLEEALKTIDFAISQPLDIGQFYACTTFPGTEIYKQALEKGIFNDYWSDYCRDPIEHNYFPNWNDPIPKDQLEKLVKHAHNRFYTSPSKLWRYLKIFNAPYRRTRVLKVAFSFCTGGIYKYNA